MNTRIRPALHFRSALIWLYSTALAIMALSAIAADDMPRPGLYEVSTKTDFGDLPIPETSVTTTNCITQQDLEQDPQKLFADGASEHCDLENFRMEGGVLTMRLTCATDEGNMEMNASGTYNDTGYSFVSNVDISLAGEQMTSVSTVTGTRKGDC